MLVEEYAEPSDHVEGCEFFGVFAADLEGDVVAYVGAGGGALEHISAVECVVGFVFCGHFWGRLWMNGGNAKLGWELIIVLACCRMLDLWSVSWDKAVFVAWGIVLEQWVLNKEESKSGFDGARIKNTESESFRGWYWSVFMLYVAKVEGKGLVYRKSSTCDHAEIVLGDFVTNTNVKTISRIAICFIFESQCYLFEMH